MGCRTRSFPAAKLRELPMSVTSWGLIGALIGAVLGVALAFGLNFYVLGLVDWAQQDVLGGGVANPFILAGIGALAGGFLALIVKLS